MTATPPASCAGRAPGRRPMLPRPGPPGWKSGMRLSHSSIETFISMRARFEPAQRWMPTPNAMCGFFSRSRITSSGFSKTRGVAVGGREVHQHLARLRPSGSRRTRCLGDVARHRHGRVRAQQLLDGVVDQLRLVDQALAVLGVLREVPDRGADRAPRRVDAGDEDEEAGAEHVRSPAPARHRPSAVSR